jgi:hypothetical protein
MASADTVGWPQQTPLAGLSRQRWLASADTVGWLDVSALAALPDPSEPAVYDDGFFLAFADDLKVHDNAGPP